ncbi:hypothetical protein BH18THE2_BH18THE2_16510 [soil metagenome]
MKDAILMGIDKSENQNKRLRTLVLSTNVNDYDTGEPIVDGSISMTLNSSGNQIVENPIFAKLHGLILGRKYYYPSMSKNNIISRQKPGSQSKSEGMERRQQRTQTICLYQGFITPKKN